METNLALETHFFYGVLNSKLFIQIADRDNIIVYEAETPIEKIEPIVLVQEMSKLFPQSFKNSGIKIPRLGYFEWDGQKIVKSGQKEIQDCQTIKDSFPQFSRFLFSYIWEGGKH
jgi:hypothetical protein